MKTLVIVTGATGSGKTDLSIELAGSLGTEIVSADSRQIYRDIPIGTAAPTSGQLARVRHHLVGILDLDSYYSAALFEQDALRILDGIWAAHGDFAVMCGGSMMYIDALTSGIDPLPTVLPEYREKALRIYQDGGLKALHEALEIADPQYLRKCDQCNHRRLIHALEISMQTGKPYSSLITGCKVKRDFRIVKLAVGYSREELFSRINARVDAMMDAGLEDEARKVYHLRHLNSLNTVGFKEMFAMIDGTLPRDVAIARIAKNTRVYAKKQLLWLSKDPSVTMLDPSRELLPQALAAIASAD